MEKEIKTIYSQIVIDIIEETKIRELLKECHELRAKTNLKNKHDGYVLIQALRMYERKCLSVLRNRAKRGLKHG